MKLVESLSLKTTRVGRPSKADCQSLKSARVWSQVPGVSYIYLKTQVYIRNRSLEQRLFQRN